VLRRKKGKMRMLKSKFIIRFNLNQAYIIDQLLHQLYLG